MVSDRIERKIKKRKVLLKICLLLIFAGFLLIIFLKSDYFNIKNIIINNNKYVSKEELIILCEAKGQNIFLLRKDKIIERIKKNPYIENARIRKKLPSKLIIDVVEKKIKGLIRYDNAFINLDSEGRMVQIVNQFPDGSLPLIEGINVKQYISGQNIAADNLTIQKALKSVLSITDFNECDNLFYSINLSDPYNIILTTKGGIQILIGDWSNIEYKLSYAVSILNNPNVIGNKGYIEILPEGTAVFKRN